MKKNKECIWNLNLFYNQYVTSAPFWLDGFLKFLKHLDSIIEVNIKINNKDAKVTTENTGLDPDETIVLFDMKSIYAKSLLKEAIE